MPESGFQLDDKPYYELYQNDPKQHPEGIHIVDICVPVKPLQIRIGYKNRLQL